MAPGGTTSSAASEGVNPAQSGGLTTSPQAAETSSHYNGENSISQPAGQSGMAASQTGGMGKSHVAYGGAAMSVPENADAGQYLKMAAKAIKQHNKMMADDALSHAETRMLTRAVPAAAGTQPDASPAVTAIEHARQALSSGDYAAAAADTKMAMHAHHGMMGAGGMQPVGGADAMGGPTQ
jgi:hypothetical protein